MVEKRQNGSFSSRKSAANRSAEGRIRSGRDGAESGRIIIDGLLTIWG
jgi:hypothetical protein